MIDLDEWITELDEEPDQELADYEAYQKQLFEDYVLRKNDNQEKRKELLKRYRTGAPLTGEKDYERSWQRLILDISVGHICHTTL